MNLFKPSNIHFTKKLQFESLLIFLVIIGVLKIFYKGDYINIISLLVFSFYLTQIYYNDQVSLLENKNIIIQRKLDIIQNEINTYIGKKIRLKKN